MLLWNKKNIMKMEIVHLLCDINDSCLSRMKCLKLNDLRNSLYYLLYESFFSFLEECSNCAICFTHLSNIIYIRIYFNTYLHCQSRFIKNGGGGKELQKSFEIPTLIMWIKKSRTGKFKITYFLTFKKFSVVFYPFFMHINCTFWTFSISIWCV